MIGNKYTKIIKKSKVLKNTIWIMGERIFQMVISLFIGVISARYLGPENYGTLNFGASLVTMFSVIAKLGLDNIIIKQYVDRKKENGKILGTALIMRCASALISILMIMLIVLIIKPGDKIVLTVTVLQSIALVFQIYELIEFWFQSNLNSKYVSIAKSIAYIIVAIYKVYLLITKKTVEWFALSTTLDYALILVITLVMYKKNNGQPLKISKKIGHELISVGYHFILSGMIVTLYTQMDKIMIGAMIDEKQVGLYSAVNVICMAWGFIPEAIINSIRPTIFEAKKDNNELYLKRLKQLYGIIFWLGIFFAIGITVFAGIIINILYGEAYIEAKSTLMIAAWYTGFAYLGTARNIWNICEDKNKYVKKFVLCGAITNIILNFILIPLKGINGAAIATLITQIIVSIISPLLFKETRICSKYIIEGILIESYKIIISAFKKERLQNDIK